MKSVNVRYKSKGANVFLTGVDGFATYDNKVLILKGDDMYDVDYINADLATLAYNYCNYEATRLLETDFDENDGMLNESVINVPDTATILATITAIHKEEGLNDELADIYEKSLTDLFDKYWNEIKNEINANDTDNTCDD